MTIEIYKDVLGYEGLYQVSNLGNVKSIYTKNPNGYIKKPFKNTFGYLQVGLSKNKKRNNFMHHRLIAEAFIPNPNNYPVINHINGDKTDNRIENLEWCTQSHNVLHSFKTGLQIIPIGDNNKLSKKIINTKTGEIYHSALTLSKKLGITRETLWKWLSKPNINKTSYRYL